QAGPRGGLWADGDARPPPPPHAPTPGTPRPAAARPHPAPPDAPPPAPWDQPPAAPSPLTEEVVLRPRVDHPTEGWRAWLYRLTGGAVNLGPGRSEMAWQATVDRCRRPCPQGRRIAVISRKGGVGKTTTTLMIGHTLAAVRPDRVIAIDGNPDAGTLGHRVTRQTGATVTDALARLDTIVGYPDARSLTSQSSTRLEVLASPEDPHASRALRGSDYQAVMDELDKHYNVMLCDTGTGIMDDANTGILAAVDQIVLVTGSALDSARAAGLTLDWLDTHGHAHLVRDAVVVVNAVSELGRVDLDQVVAHFAARCRAVHRIPLDRHLEAGGVTNPDLLDPDTQEAWLEVAASVVEGFDLPSPRGTAA
uniref:MinD/ParA family ATP-binding protein n=1 Tax=Euzebya sp. TaxID=1971409 RepID=UPI0035110F0B